MALSPTYSAVAKNAALDAALDTLNGGYMKIYSGAQPASPDAAITGTLLVTLTLNATAFAAATGGSKTANAIGSAAIAVSGAASHYRLFKSDNTTAVHDGSVGVGATFNAQVPTVTFTAGVTATCSSLVISVP